MKLEADGRESEGEIVPKMAVQQNAAWGRAPAAFMIAKEVRPGDCRKRWEHPELPEGQGKGTKTPKQPISNSQERQAAILCTL